MTTMKPELTHTLAEVLASTRRPWGYWLVLDEADGYKVKRLHVAPGKRLSYQSHEHRCEHWIVMSGTATCTIDGVDTVLQSGECMDVSAGRRHRLANSGMTELIVIEVQRGAYTGEDDIVRFEDDFHRVSPR